MLRQTVARHSLKLRDVMSALTLVELVHGTGNDDVAKKKLECAPMAPTYGAQALRRRHSC